jgi:hypothetical protein
MAKLSQADIQVKQFYLTTVRRYLANLDRLEGKDIDRFFEYMNDSVVYLLAGKHEHCRALLTMAGALIGDDGDE